MMCFPKHVVIDRKKTVFLLKDVFQRIGYCTEAAGPAEYCAFLASIKTTEKGNNDGAENELDQLRYNYVVQRLLVSLLLNGEYLLTHYTLPDLTFVPSHKEARFSEGTVQWHARKNAAEETKKMMAALSEASETIRDTSTKKCRFCKSTNVVSYQRQTRGGDEAFTEFHECLACKKHY